MREEEIIILIKARNEARAALKNANASLGTLGKRTKEVARAMKTQAREAKAVRAELVATGRRYALYGAAIAAATVVAGKKLFDLGAAAFEVENVTGLAFGNMKTAAQDWAKTYAEATGSSRFESIQLVSDMGLMVKGMGFTSEASLEMSARMVELAGDMSSAKDIPLAEALEKIRSGLVGEAEPHEDDGCLAFGRPCPGGSLRYRYR